MERTARARGIPPEFSVAALVAASCVPLFRLFSSGGLGGVVILSLGLSLSIAVAARRNNVPALAAWLASAAALFWFISVRFLPETLWGPFPSLETFRELGPVIAEASKRIIEDSAPVAPTVPLMVMVTAGIWMTAWLTEAAAFWIGNPLLAIASTTPMFVIPGAITPSRRLWFDVAAWVVAAAWVLFETERVRAASMTARADSMPGWRARPAVRIALAGAIIAAAAMPLMPGYGGAPAFNTAGLSDRVVFNPLVAVRPTLNHSPARTLLTVRMSEPSYLRLTTLDTFDGKQWQIAKGRTTSAIEGLRVSPDAPEVASRLMVQEVEILALAGPWLPTAYDPVVLRPDVPIGAVLENESRAVIMAEGSLQPGVRYEVTSEVPRPRVADLDRPATYDEDLFAADLALPKLPRQVADLARQIAGDQPTPYRKALALQDHLRTFTYDLNVAEGHSYSTLLQFLTEAKRGYCEQFSAAMAVMARSLGIPARVAIGFGYGKPLDDHGLYRISTTEAHAWTEIYIPGSGWLAFEPTPRAGVTNVPEYARPQAAPLPSGSASPSPSASPGESPEPTATATNTKKDPGEAAGGSGARAQRPAWLLPIIVIVAGAFLLASVAAVLAILRRRRWVHRPAREAVAARYVDFLEWCAAVGFGRAPGETPLEHASRLGLRAPPAAEPLSRVAALADEALWGVPNGLVEADFVDAASAARAALVTELPRFRRAIAGAGWGRWRA